jgi:hypothetical protein
MLDWELLKLLIDDVILFPVIDIGRYQVRVDCHGFVPCILFILVNVVDEVIAVLIDQGETVLADV